MSAHVEDKLSAYHDGELSAAERVGVETHLRSCADCTRELRLIEAVDASARDLAVETPPGYFETFAGRVRQRLPVAPAAARPMRLPAWTWAVAATLVIAVVVPLALREAPAPPAAAMAPQSRADRSMAPPPPMQEAPAPAAPAPAEAKVAPMPVQRKAKSPATNVPAEAAKADGGGTDSRQFAAPPAAAPAQDLAGLKRQANAATEKDSRAKEESTARDELQVAGAVADAEPRRAKAAAPGAASGAPSIYRELARRSTRSLADARALREEWRAFLATSPATPVADEARVRMIEAGAEAFRRSADSLDLEIVRRDAADYLKRPDAAQAERVRHMLSTLER